MSNFWNRRRGNVAEAQDYLRATDTVSRPMALLLGLLGFLVVFAIVFSMFLGGRWLISRLTGDSNREVASEESSVLLGSAEDSGRGFTAPDVDLGIGVSGSTDDTAQQQDQGVTVVGESSTTSTATTAQNDTATVADQLPRTGAGSTISLLVAVSVLAGFGHSQYLKTKS